MKKILKNMHVGVLGIFCFLCQNVSSILWASGDLNGVLISLTRDRAQKETTYCRFHGLFDENLLTEPSSTADQKRKILLLELPVRTEHIKEQDVQMDIVRGLKLSIAPHKKGLSFQFIQNNSIIFRAKIHFDGTLSVAHAFLNEIFSLYLSSSFNIYFRDSQESHLGNLYINHDHAHRSMVTGLSLCFSGHWKISNFYGYINQFVMKQGCCLNVHGKTDLKTYSFSKSNATFVSALMYLYADQIDNAKGILTGNDIIIHHLSSESGHFNNKDGTISALHHIKLHLCVPEIDTSGALSAPNIYLVTFPRGLS